MVPPGIDPNGNAADYLITPDLGQEVGDTLLHSFLRLGLETGEVGTFTGAETLRHIVARVTGNEISSRSVTTITTSRTSVGAAW